MLHSQAEKLPLYLGCPEVLDVSGGPGGCRHEMVAALFWSSPGNHLGHLQLHFIQLSEISKFRAGAYNPEIFQTVSINRQIVLNSQQCQSMLSSQQQDKVQYYTGCRYYTTLHM